MSHGDDEAGIPWPTKEQVRAPEHEAGDQSLIDLIEAGDFSSLTVYAHSDGTLLLTLPTAEMLFLLDLSSTGMKAHQVDPDTVELDELEKIQ